MMARFVVDIDPTLKQQLRSKLILEGVSLKEWLHRQILSYLTTAAPHSPYPGFTYTNGPQETQPTSPAIAAAFPVAPPQQPARPEYPPQLKYSPPAEPTDATGNGKAKS